MKRYLLFRSTIKQLSFLPALSQQIWSVKLTKYSFCTLGCHLKPWQVKETSERCLNIKMGVGEVGGGNVRGYLLSVFGCMWRYCGSFNLMANFVTLLSHSLCSKEEKGENMKERKGSWVEVRKRKIKKAKAMWKPRERKLFSASHQLKAMMWEAEPQWV